MRFVIVGVGAVGGTLAARLALSGYDVLAVARGAHGAAIRDHGLTFESPGGSQVVPLAVTASVDEVDATPGDVIVLGMKSQDTLDVLHRVRLQAPAATPIVCLQNGVDNERQALRMFPNVYGVCVMLPGEHLRPGVVRNYTSPVAGILDLGRYPHGTDAVSDAIAAVWQASGFESVSRPDIMRWKYRKLLMNLGNAIEALLGTVRSWPAEGELVARVYAEGAAALAAAGIDVASEDEDRQRRGDVLRMQPVGGVRRDGGSTYQSLQRGTPVETDYLTGEITLLGRLYGVPTPANDLLQRLVVEAAASGAAPARYTEPELLALLAPAGRGE